MGWIFCGKMVKANVPSGKFYDQKLRGAIRVQQSWGYDDRFYSDNMRPHFLGDLAELKWAMNDEDSSLPVLIGSVWEDDPLTSEELEKLIDGVAV